MLAASRRVMLGCAVVLAGAGAVACERFSQADRSANGTEHPALYPQLGDPDKGRRIVADIGCGACHVIPGVPGARGVVGPSLKGFGQRKYISGVFPNEPSVLTRWVRNAPSLAPDTAMPALPMTREQARHVTAYLYTLW